MSTPGFSPSAPIYPLQPGPAFKPAPRYGPAPNYPYPAPPPTYQATSPILGLPLQSVHNKPAVGYPTLGFDQFQRLQLTPALRLNLLNKLALLLLHPIQYYQFSQSPPIPAPGEGLFETMHRYNKISGALDPLARKQFQSLLKQGVLYNTKTDDGHSTLFHLYAMLSTRRASGFDNKILVKETVEILNKPFAITQRFAPLTDGVARQILLARNYPGLIGSSVMPPVKPLTLKDLNVDSSATCVASSVMYYMADKEPAELTRHLNELTSPLNAFFEKVKLSEISPDNPAEVINILRESKIPFYVSGPGELTVKVENPPAGYLRAVDSQRFQTESQYRNGIEAAYQSALTYLATHTYDPANDMRDSETPGEGSKGLTEAEKTLMETIVKENGGVQSVTYQAVAGKANPKPGEDGNSYLFGYYRSFEQITADLLQSLRMGEPVIIGTTDTDQSGAIVTGHEITVTGAYVDATTNQLNFIVADSDDNVPRLVAKPAKDLIPTIHHVGLPLTLARKINQEISANGGGYMVPDRQDAANFKLLHRETGPMPVDTDETTTQEPPPAYQPRPAANEIGIPATPPPVYSPFAPGISPAMPPANGPFTYPIKGDAKPPLPFTLPAANTQRPGNFQPYPTYRPINRIQPFQPQPFAQPLPVAAAAG